jgi:TonB family protein
VKDSRLEELGRELGALARRLPAARAIELDISSSQGMRDDDAYARIVRFFYTHSWQPEQEATDPKAKAKVSVTVDSDGRVASAQIVEPSGDTLLDQSVRRALERVLFIEPFEPRAGENQRTFTLNFTLRNGEAQP